VKKTVDTHSTSLTQPTQIFTFAHSIVKHRQKSGFRRLENNRLYRVFRLFSVGIRYFPVFKIPMSVSVSVLKNIGYLFGFSVNRPTSRVNGYRAIRQLTNSVTRRFGDKAGRFGERLGRFGNTIGRFGDNYTNSVTRRFVNRQQLPIGYTVYRKKEATKLLAITFSSLNRFSKFFHC